MIRTKITVLNGKRVDLDIRMLDIRRNSLRVVTQWNTLPKEAVDVPLLEVLRLDVLRSTSFSGRYPYSWKQGWN